MARRLTLDQLLQQPSAREQALTALVGDLERSLEYAELGDLSLHRFIQRFWHVLEPSTTFTDGWVVGAVAEHLEALSLRQLKKLIINIPPGYMKSLMTCVFWPAWRWTREPGERWLMTSSNYSKALADAQKMRLLIYSLEYQAAYGHLYQLLRDQNMKHRFANDRTGFRLVSAYGSALGERADVLVVDDPNKQSEVYSKAHRTQVNDGYDQTLSQRGTSAERFVQVVIMQRLHEEDLTGHLLERGGWEHLCLPAEYEPSRRAVTRLPFQDPRTQEGELLWPERDDRASINEKKHILGSYGTSGQLQQRPSPAAGGVFKRHWWRYWAPAEVAEELPPVYARVFDEEGGQEEVVEIGVVALPKKFDEMLQSWDMSFKDTKSSAYVCAQVWGRKGSSKYLLDQIRDKLDFVSTLSAVRALSARWPRVTAKIIEDKANGPAVINVLRGKLEGLIAWNPPGSKESRANAVSPQVEAGNVFLPHPSVAAWVQGFVDEAAAFPNGAYKDQVDSFTQALLRFSRQKRRRKDRDDTQTYGTM